MAEGYGYEISARDVSDAFTHTMQAAEASGTAAETTRRIRILVADAAPDGTVRRVLGRVLMIDE